MRYGIKGNIIQVSLLLLVSTFFAGAAPTRVTTLSPVTLDGTTLTLSWVAPTPTSGQTLSANDIRMSNVPINALNWASRTIVSDVPAPSAPGSTQTVTVSNLTQNATYYFAIKVRDTGGGWSLLSNLVAVFVRNSTRSVTLAWDANEEDDLAGYRIYYATFSGGRDLSIDVGNVTTATVNDLDWTTYFFVVRAYNTSNLESLDSNEVSSTP